MEVVAFLTPALPHAECSFHSLFLVYKWDIFVCIVLVAATHCPIYSLSRSQLDQSTENFGNWKATLGLILFSVFLPLTQKLKIPLAFFPAPKWHGSGTNSAVVSHWEGMSHESCFL